jgi:hypothetical protein
MHPLLKDPWVAAQIDAATAPYRRLWTEDQLRAFREQMAETLASHPKAARLLRLAHPGLLDQSAEVPIEDEAAPPAVEPTGKSGAGRRSAG